MSDTSQGPGWWRASDGRWYPADQHPDAARTAATSASAPPPVGPPTSGPPSGGSSRRGAPVWLVAVAVFVAVVVGAAAVLFLTRDDDTAASDEVQELVLEPIGASGSDPFTDSVAVGEVEVATEVSPAEGGSADVELIVAGTQPELYGGSGDAQVCEVAELVSFLEENPAEAAAFAGVLGIGADDIGGYVSGLTPVLLRVDTRVTNHGFRDGAATPFQAVLQAGTAVLVDAFGVPRVKCNCGNPLAEPAPLPEALPAAEESGRVTVVGDPWPTWDPAQTVVVDAGEDEVAEFTVVDVETGEAYTTAVGTATTGTAPIVLVAEGLGIAGPGGEVAEVIPFGTPIDEVVSRISEVLGEPTGTKIPGGPDGRGESGCEVVEHYWDELTVAGDGFLFWNVANYRYVDGGSVPTPVEVAGVAATPEGIGAASSADEVAAAYPDATATDSGAGSFVQYELPDGVTVSFELADGSGAALAEPRVLISDTLDGVLDTC